MADRLPPYLPPLVTAVLWGGMFPIASTAMHRIDPEHLAVIRFGIASVLLLALLAAVEGRGALRYDGRLRPALTFGSLGFAGFQVLGYVGLRHTTPQHASLIVATQPVLAVLGRWRMTGDRPSNRLLGFIALAFAGVALVVVGDDPAAALHGGVGDLMVFGGAACWVRYTLSAATDYPGWSPLRLTALTTAAGTFTIIVMAVLGDLTGILSPPSVHDLHVTTWALAYMSLLGVFVAMLGWNAGVARLGPARTTLFMNLVPVTTFAIEAVRGAVPSAVELVGAAITLAALVGANVLMRATAVVPAPAAAGPAAARSAAELA